MKDLKSRDGCVGRLARRGLGSGSGGIDDEGSDGAGGGAWSDRLGGTGSKSGKLRAKAEGCLEDRTDGVSAWRTSGEGCV